MSSVNKPSHTRATDGFSRQLEARLVRGWPNAAPPGAGQDRPGGAGDRVEIALSVGGVTASSTSGACKWGSALAVDPHLRP